MHNVMDLARTKPQERSEITRSHLLSKIFTASVNNTSGGSAPVDSIVTVEQEKQRIFRTDLKIFTQKTTVEH